MRIKKFIDLLLNNHFEIIKNEVDESEYPIDYDYFLDKYGSINRPGKNVVYSDLRQQVDALKNNLEKAGYEVELDMQYGLRLIVSK